MTNRQLIVMRHSKAEAFAANDHERTLTDRGVHDASDAGRHLADTGRVPDHALVSSAARALATWEAVAKASGSTADATVDDAVYGGSADVVMEALRTVPEDAEIVIFVGHNPTAASLAHELEDGHGEPEVLQEMLSGYATSAFAVFEVEVPWSELAPETGRIVDFYVGRG